MAILNELVKYATAIIDGKKIACEKYKWACLRFLDDLKKRGKWAWEFDESAAERYFEWMKLFRYQNVDGELVRKTPCEYEIFVYGNIYGWKNKHGERRFKQSYEQLARKQAKSQNKAIQALYEISIMGMGKVQGYIAATKLAQAQFVFDEAVWLMKASDTGLDKKFTYKFSQAHNKKVITHIKSQSTFSKLSREDRTLGDGSNPHFCVIDEYHQHPTSEFFDLFKRGMAARKNSLLSVITTAGHNLHSPCYEEYKHVSKILDPNDPATNDRYFVAICELDKNETHENIITPDGRTIPPGGVIDKLGTVTAITKACPVTGHLKVLRENYKDDLTRLDIPSEYRSILTKSYNVWIDAKADGFLNMAKWGYCKRTPDAVTKIINFHKTQGNPLPCFVGFDLSKTTDLTSVAFVFPFIENGAKKFIVLSHSFIPSEKLQERIHVDKMPFDAWARHGLVTMTEGAVIDYRHVKKWTYDEIEKNGWDAKEFCLDPYAATALINELQDDGKTAVEIRQGYRTLSEPTKAFRENVYNKNILHDTNPVLSWAVSNAVTRSDHNANIMLDKEKSSQRIDPLAAVINAFVRANAYDGEKGKLALEAYFDAPRFF